MGKERTFVMIKPDAVRRNLGLEICARIEKAGFRCLKIERDIPTDTMVEEHYREHKGKPWFNSNVEFICSGPAFICIFEGEDAIPSIRKLMGNMNEKGVYFILKVINIIKEP